MAELNEISVRVYKYDGVECRRWHACLARRDGPLLVLDAEFEFDVRHDFIGEIQKGARTVEYYWLDRWFAVFRFLDNNQAVRLYYCNINTPPTFRNGVLSYIDLDIDILVRPDFSYEILDLDEFEINAARFQYTDETKQNARQALDDLISMIELREFPFDER